MLTKEKAMSTHVDNYSARKAVDDAGAEIAQAILNYREGEIDLGELVTLVTYHIPEATQQQVVEAASRRYDA